MEVHALLRPAEGRPRAGVREGVPDRLDPVRRARRAARARASSGSRSSRTEGWNGARLYGHDPDDGVGGFGAFFLLLDEPEVYGLPPDPVVPTAPPAAALAVRRRSPRRRCSSGSRRHSSEAANDRLRERPRSDDGLVLRAHHRQGAGLEAGDPALLLHRRDRRRILGAPRRSRGSPATTPRASQPSTSAPRPTPSRRCCSISDLGRPERFLNMLRMFKVTSPMSVGSWILLVSGGASNTAAALELARRSSSRSSGPPRRHRSHRPAARDLHRSPDREHGDPGLERGARRAAVALRRERRRERRRRRGDLHADRVGRPGAPSGDRRRRRRARPDAGDGDAGSASSARSTGRARPDGSTGSTKACTVAGAGLIAWRGKQSRAATVAGGALVLAGELALRWSVFRAGFQSARDPRYTVLPQKERLKRKKGEHGS